MILLVIAIPDKQAETSADAADSLSELPLATLNEHLISQISLFLTVCSSPIPKLSVKLNRCLF